MAKYGLDYDENGNLLISDADGRLGFVIMASGISWVEMREMLWGWTRRFGSWRRVVGDWWLDGLVRCPVQRHVLRTGIRARQHVHQRNGRAFFKGSR